MTNIDIIYHARVWAVGDRIKFHTYPSDERKERVLNYCSLKTLNINNFD
jgi:hypothetical protein